MRIELDGTPSTLAGTEERLHVDPGARVTHSIDLRLPTLPIEGHVRFEEGDWVAGAALRASCRLTGDGFWERLHVTARSATDGSYSLAVPDLGRPYRIEAELDNARHAVEGVRAGARGVELVLSRSGALQFRFRDARTDALHPATAFELGWKRADEEEFEHVYLGSPLAPDADGWYELRLPCGRLDLRVKEPYPATFLPLLLEGVSLQAREPRRVEFLVRPGATVELRLAPDQAPFPSDHVLLLVEAEHWDEVRPEGNSWDGGRLGEQVLQRFVHFDEQGAARRTGLPRGRFRFKVFPDDLVIEPAEIMVGEEESAPVLVRWQRTR